MRPAQEQPKCSFSEVSVELQWFAANVVQLPHYFYITIEEHDHITKKSTKTKMAPGGTNADVQFQ